MKNTYPSPLASYEEVVADKDLFMSTLKKLHSQMDTDFWIPKVRFADMDLHKIFVEVTSRGGIDKIVKEEKWKETFDTFNFPKSQRNPIFRKHVLQYYYSLLRNYEMVYFFKARGQVPPLTGSVNGKAKSAYHVTLKIGSWKLRGVMYESTEERVTQDPEKQSHDVSPNHKEHFEKANNQKEKQWSPKQNTEANSPMQESEEQEGYDSSGYNSEEQEGHSSGYNSKEQEGHSSGYNSDGYNSKEQEGHSSGYSSDGYNSKEQEGNSRGYNYDETETNMEKGDDLMDTSLVDDSLTGVLDEIFDRAYSVTVTIGSDMLRGALFRFPPLGEDKKSGLRRRGSGGGQRAM